MRFHYLIYQEARERLESGGLLERIREAHDSVEGLPHIGHTTDSDVVQAIKEMQEEGYFESLEKGERIAFQKGLQKAFGDMQGHSWKVHREGNIIENPAEPEDFYLMTGWLGSCVMKPDELWDFQRFGFNSLNDFVGALGAAVWLSHSIDFRGGYKWISRTERGRVLQNNITGDINLDLRIYQTDVTPDKTFDPVGAEVSYRPELDEDRGRVSAYHSTEPEFLGGVLKWVNQQDIPSEMLKDNGRHLIDWTRYLGHRIGAAAECYDISGLNSPMILLGNFYEPIPVLDENYSTDMQSFDSVGTMGDGSFCMYVGPSKELIFAHEEVRGRENKKNPAVVFQPSEADHLLRGICYQAARGLGRTSPQKLISMLKYRFSEQMDIDMERIRRKV